MYISKTNAKFYIDECVIYFLPDVAIDLYPDNRTPTPTCAVIHTCILVSAEISLITPED